MAVTPLVQSTSAATINDNNGTVQGMPGALVRFVPGGVCLSNAECVRCSL
jgi:hypothetical protein